MTTLTDFLLDRIAEDEDEANALMPTLRYDSQWPKWQRVLRECDGKRRIVADAADVLDAPFGKFGKWFVRFWLAGQVTHTLQCLALPYADHPDYREEWKP